MPKNLVVAVATVAAIVSAAAYLAQAASARGDDSAKTCDRACLENLVDKYLAALVAHDPSQLPITDDVRFTENDVTLKLGEGLWRTASGLDAYRHTIEDPDSGQIALFATIRENGMGDILVARIKSRNQRISELETIVIRTPSGAVAYDKFGKLGPVWNEIPPRDKRISRERLIYTANLYLNGMQKNDGKGNYSFFAPDCQRIENAVQATNVPKLNDGHSINQSFATLGCEAQFKLGMMGFVTNIRDRRYPIVDEEKQEVVAFSILDHDSTVRELPLTDGTTNYSPPYFLTPRTLPVTDAFKFKDGKIRFIEMTLTEAPWGSNSGWEK
ncbi:MAG TPA: hypothetical protein VJO53_15185 [Candidatus Acidoferrales bacterium]|nr:hypothetical protein [Candidatus Acidoferrales bacterium]